MTELQNYRMTDRTKTICPPIFDLGGIKIAKFHFAKILGLNLILNFSVKSLNFTLAKISAYTVNKNTTEFR